MTDNIKLPPMLESDHEIKVRSAAGQEWGYRVFSAEQMQAYAREAVRLNAQAVPDGWKLVPIEPTDEMEMAWDDAHGDGAPFHSMYSAMLSAAPAAPQPAQPLTDEQLYGMHRLNLRIRAGTRNRSQE